MSDSFLRQLEIAWGQTLELLSQWADQHLVDIIFILLGAWLVRHFGMRVIGGILRHTVRSDLYPTKADREKRLKTLNSMAGAFVRGAIYVVAAILIVGEINPQYTTALFASAGLIGVAIGFGAKDVINDFMSGIFIITENQYRVGDVIAISNISGTVEDITIRTTVLRDQSGNVHHVPNGSIDVTTNKTLGYSRINENISVAADTDLKRLEHIINHVGQELAAHHDFKDKILDPPHFARIVGLNETGVTIKVVSKTVSGEQWEVKSELYQRLLATFKQHDIIVSGPKGLTQD